MWNTAFYKWKFKIEVENIKNHFNIGGAQQNTFRYLYIRYYYFVFVVGLIYFNCGKTTSCG